MKDLIRKILKEETNPTEVYNIFEEGEFDPFGHITDENNGKFWELEETLENMYLYGINNVRGSMFTKFTLSREDKIKAAQLYCEMYDLCRKCGSDKHYIYNCKHLGQL